MKYIESPVGSFVDRKQIEQNTEEIDVIMLTLDSDNFLEKCLYSIYKEIPIRKLIICDGGSRDETIKILEDFPRIELYIRPDIRTTGKGLEFLISKVQTDWFIIIDSDLQLFPGWYDEMRKYKQDKTVLENGRRILAYHMYFEDVRKLEDDRRASSLCHLIQKDAVRDYHCDDDYMWRYTDIFLRQIVEKSGYKYVKIDSTAFVHNETNRLRYESDDEKNFQEFIWEKPALKIINEHKKEQLDIKNAKAIVKYLDPELPALMNKSVDSLIMKLERDWIIDNGSTWLKRYDDAKLLKNK